MQRHLIYKGMNASQTGRTTKRCIKETFVLAKHAPLAKLYLRKGIQTFVVMSSFFGEIYYFFIIFFSYFWTLHTFVFFNLESNSLVHHKFQLHLNRCTIEIELNRKNLIGIISVTHVSICFMAAEFSVFPVVNLMFVGIWKLETKCNI